MNIELKTHQCAIEYYMKEHNIISCLSPTCLSGKLSTVDDTTFGKYFLMKYSCITMQLICHLPMTCKYLQLKQICFILL